MDVLRIPQNTKKGYEEVPVGGVFDFSYPTSTTRRGRVQEGGAVSPTICCECPPFYFEEVIDEEEHLRNQQKP